MQGALRIAGELLGLAFVILVLFLCYVLVLGGGLTALWLLLAGGIAVVVVLVYLMPRWMRLGLPYRALFDLWLLALVPAALVTLLAVRARWPIRVRAMDAHGWGTTGGEMNVLFLSWLHAAFWLTLALMCLRTARRKSGAG